MICECNWSGIRLNLIFFIINYNLVSRIPLYDRLTGSSRAFGNQCMACCWSDCRHVDSLSLCTLVFMIQTPPPCMSCMLMTLFNCIFRSYVWINQSLHTGQFYINVGGTDTIISEDSDGPARVEIRRRGDLTTSATVGKSLFESTVHWGGLWYL